MSVRQGANGGRTAVRGQYNADGDAYSDEWYTPAKYIEAARTAMGGIDLDPASSDYAQCTVKAIRYYTQEMDGLRLPWNGRIWLNPPYSGSPKWCRTLRHKYENGEIGQACLLVNAWTESKWFHGLFDFPICFVGPGRIAFESTRGARNPVSNSAVIYMGDRVRQFAAAFCTLGRVVVPYVFQVHNTEPIREDDPIYQAARRA